MAETTGESETRTEGEPKGRALVRARLIEPLMRDGLARPRRLTVGEHEDELRRLAEALAYMSPEALDGLRAMLMRPGAAPMRGGVAEWPRLTALIQYAWRFERPPPRGDRYLVSVLVSALGRRAYDEGWLTELAIDCRRRGPPPPPLEGYGSEKLRDEARANRERRERLRQITAEGRSLTSDEASWLAWYHKTAAEAEAIHRREGGEQTGAAA